MWPQPRPRVAVSKSRNRPTQLGPKKKMSGCPGSTEGITKWRHKKKKKRLCLVVWQACRYQELFRTQPDISPVPTESSSTLKCLNRPHSPFQSPNQWRTAPEEYFTSKSIDEKIKTMGCICRPKSKVSIARNRVSLPSLRVCVRHRTCLLIALIIDRPANAQDRSPRLRSSISYAYLRKYLLPLRLGQLPVFHHGLHLRQVQKEDRPVPLIPEILHIYLSSPYERASHLPPL